MAWVRRYRNARYFYRSVRRNGRATKEYIGNGQRAHELAARMLRERQEDQADRAAVIAIDAELQPVDSVVADLDLRADVIAEATLLSSGCYRHHQGEWRKRRARKA